MSSIEDINQAAIDAIDSAMHDWKAAVHRLSEPEQVEAGSALSRYLLEQVLPQPAAVRREAVRSLRRVLTVRACAELLGMSPARVQQIVEGR